MRASPWSLALFMVVLGVASLWLGLDHGARPSGSAIAVAIGLAVGAVALLTRHRIGFWIALASAGATVALAVLSFVTQREIGLRPAPVSLVAGLYIVLRLILARTVLAQKPSLEPED